MWSQYRLYEPCSQTNLDLRLNQNNNRFHDPDFWHNFCIPGQHSSTGRITSALSSRINSKVLRVTRRRCVASLSAAVAAAAAHAQLPQAFTFIAHARRVCTCSRCVTRKPLHALRRICRGIEQQSAAAFCIVDIRATALASPCQHAKLGGGHGWRTDICVLWRARSRSLSGSLPSYSANRAHRSHISMRYNARYIVARH